jgi:oligoribonuclease (3'-5' exoribonuclease)
MQAIINAGNVKIIKARIERHLKAEIDRFHKLRTQVLKQEYLSGNLDEIENSAVDKNDEEMAMNYLKHVLKSGSADERQQVLSMIKTKFILTKRELRLK